MGRGTPISSKTQQHPSHSPLTDSEICAMVSALRSADFPCCPVASTRTEAHRPACRPSRPLQQSLCVLIDRRSSALRNRSTGGPWMGRRRPCTTTSPISTTREGCCQHLTPNHRRMTSMSPTRSCMAQAMVTGEPLANAFAPFSSEPARMAPYARLRHLHEQIDTLSCASRVSTPCRAGSLSERMRATLPSARSSLRGSRVRCCAAVSQGFGRRGVLAGIAIIAPFCPVAPSRAEVDVTNIQGPDLTSQFTPLLRTAMSPAQALANLKDAELSLEMVIKVARTGPEDPVRAKAEAMWPGWAKFVRTSGDSAILLATRYSDSLQFSRRYGGGLPPGSEPTAVDRLLNSVGDVVTISGRTIRPEARVDPSLAEAALESLRAVLKDVPREAARDTTVIAQRAPPRT